MTLDWWLAYKTDIVVKSDFLKIFTINRKLPKGWYISCTNGHGMTLDNVENIQRYCLRYMDYESLLKMFQDCGANFYCFKFFGEQKSIPYFETKEQIEIFYMTLKMTEPNNYCNVYRGEVPDGI